MTYGESIRDMPDQLLASLLIKKEYILPYWLVTSDGQKFNENEYQEAVRHEVWWLNQEATCCCERKQ